jgi:DNA mismatch repair protein MutS
MNGVLRYVTFGEELVTKHWLPDMKSAFFIGEEEYESLGEFKDFSASQTGFNLFSNFGTKLKHYKYFKNERYISLLRHTYIIDAISSIFKMGFCFPQYRSGATPTIEINSLWHPSLTNPVYNNLTIDKNILITGPNAGGKSTLIKSCLMAILFAQTFGVANAKSMTFTPFFYINSQMNIPDCKGKESLFEAEMYRSKANLDRLKELDGKLSIIFMDEIFNSTNPVEGIAGAYAIAKRMSSYLSNLSIITTHYIYLTKLAKTERFVNMKMNVLISKDDIKYPYKIGPGFSRQYIALELLKKNGFDKDVVEEALAIKARLT